MKSKTNINIYKLNTTNKISFFIVLAVCISFFVISTNAQTRPSPTPRETIPVVVSRDSDSVKKTNNSDVRETVSNKDNIVLPRENNPPTSNTKTNTSVKQKKLMLYLDLLTRTEQRAASLQKQLFELIEKQNSLSANIKRIEYQLRPEVITASTNLTGSLRPENLRQQRKESLEIEKTNAESLLQILTSRKSLLEENVRKSDALVERIRVRFDKIIDDALNEDNDI